MKTIHLLKNELQTINEIVNENDLNDFTLIIENSSGIGYTLDVEFEMELNGRTVKVRVPVTGVENW